MLQTPGTDYSREFTVHHRSREFPVSLRVCDDQFPAAWVTVAAKDITAGFMDKRNRVADGFFLDEERVNRIFNLITVQGKNGGHYSTDEDGNRQFTPLPWESWLELNLDELKTILAGFFLSAVKKISISSSTASTMDWMVAMTYVSSAVMKSWQSSSAPQEASQNATQP